MAVIFDLDQTLIDSSAAEPLRRAREWSRVYNMIPQLLPFPGINDMLKLLDQKNIPYSIVTSSPSSYCSRVIHYWKWKVHSTVCYHDTQRRKPHPDPMNLAVTKLGVPKELVVSVGDDARDVEAAKSAGIISVGALWGAENKSELLASSPDFLFDKVDQLVQFLNDRYLN
ncbi:HAD family hydrolase [Paenibacillus sp. 3LSP]|uniref:HAD family hydrolase n=1 Tax=Paenibacillus sp. 3LSP TaxID=2800795 RepID=UPI0005432799|nr:HAD family hydrolase [Paenibacillus sp. 3LSP]KHF28368.1 Phosphoglycolate phosphatase [Paenibacillus sp. P1XP2]MDU0330993.1 HAD family hydrolase [Paenibacillus sp. 3LSP]